MLEYEYALLHGLDESPRAQSRALPEETEEIVVDAGPFDSLRYAGNSILRA